MTQKLIVSLLLVVLACLAQAQDKVPIYHVCDGKDLEPKECADGLECVFEDSGYMAYCQLKDEAGTVAPYGQCGGKGYTGPKKCHSSCGCKKWGDYFSQCTYKKGVLPEF